MINVFKYALTAFSRMFSEILRCVLVHMADDNSTEPYAFALIVQKSWSLFFYCLNLKIRTLRPFDTSENIELTTRRNILEDFSQKGRSDNFQPRSEVSR
jgi:hypothetical protein